jgi:hypothetical protein
VSSPGRITDHTGDKAKVLPELYADTSAETEVIDASKRYPTRKDLENALLEANGWGWKVAIHPEMKRLN